MSATKWKKANSQILLVLDLKAEYAALGLRLAGDKPRATGWLPAHAMGREDRTPSAEINVGDGPARGRYRDFGNGTTESLSLFDFAVLHGPAATWQEARSHFAKKTGIKLPRGDESARAKDRLELRDLTAVEKLRWAKAKQGVSMEAIDLVGARGALWPKGLPPEMQQSLLTVPMFGHGLLELDPVAYHSAPLAGKYISKFKGKGNPPDLIRTMTLGSPGIMGLWGIRHLPEAEVVWLVEGLSDMLALQSLLKDRKDHVVLSCGGASYRIPEDCVQHFGEKDTRVLFDNDEPGQNGAAIQVGWLVGVASAVRNVQLPSGVKDLRDWINAGHGYSDLWQHSGGFAPAGPEAAAAVPSVPKITNGEMKLGFDKPKPRPIADIIRDISAATDNWPRRAGGELFIHDDGADNVDALADPASLFGWLGQRLGVIDWNQGSGFTTKAELYAELRRTVTAYDGIESIPHFPEIPGRYYTCPLPEPGGGRALQQFLDFFTFSGDVDRQLFQALLATPLWGGPPGSRPAGLITATGGRGRGKSAAAMAIANVFGGYVDIGSHEDGETIKKRLLSPDADSLRMVMLDNVKSQRFSWAELESLITTQVVSGWRPYVGNASRPNTLTWLITLNGASLSTDLAQRVIEIRLGEPSYTRDWQDRLNAFIKTKQAELLADLVGFLQQPKADLTHGRWATWERDIVGRLPDPTECLALIERRRGEIDAEEEEGALVQDYFARRLAALEYDLNTMDIFIPAGIAAEWYNAATGNRTKVAGVSRILKQLNDEKRIDRIVPYRHCKSGRGVRWIGELCGATDPTEYDLADRIAKKRKQEKTGSPEKGIF